MEMQTMEAIEYIGLSALVNTYLQQAYCCAISSGNLRALLCTLYVSYRNLHDTYLKPYFAGKFRPVHSGDLFRVRGNSGTVEFKVIRLEPEPYSIVGPETRIFFTGTPVKRAVSYPVPIYCWLVLAIQSLYTVGSVNSPSGPGYIVPMHCWQCEFSIRSLLLHSEVNKLRAGN